MITEFVVTLGETRKRLDQFLVHREREISRSALQRLIQSGRIRVNSRVAKPGWRIKPGDHITMDTPEPGPLLVKGQPLDLEILYEDEWLLVVNKPPGVVVHPTSGNWSGTLINALLGHFQKQGDVPHSADKPGHPGIVHRLDKDTSGVMVVAKTLPTHRALSSLFERHTITRIYQALLWSVPKCDYGLIEQAIGRDVHNSKISSVHSTHLKPAVTEYRVLRAFGNSASLVQLTPGTGRTHQLRVHVRLLGCPILGDATYGGDKVCRIGAHEIGRVMLHAQTLGFKHPATGVYQEHSSNVPDDMQTVFTSLLSESNSASREKAYPEIGGKLP